MNVNKVIPKIVGKVKEVTYSSGFNKLDCAKAVSNPVNYSEAPVSAEAAKILKSLMHSETISGKTFLIERDTGKKIPIFVTKFERGDKKYLYLKDENCQKLGHLALEKPQRGYFQTAVGDDYIYNSMEMTELESINKGHKLSKYRGIGIELFKFAVLESKKSGFNGRLHLMAYNSVPPTPFYYKIGLRFIDDNKNKMMEDFIKMSANSQIELPEKIRQGLIYLPDENIDKLLNL